MKKKMFLVISQTKGYIEKKTTISKVHSKTYWPLWKVTQATDRLDIQHILGCCFFFYIIIFSPERQPSVAHAGVHSVSITFFLLTSGSCL